MTTRSRVAVLGEANLTPFLANLGEGGPAEPIVSRSYMGGGFQLQRLAAPRIHDYPPKIHGDMDTRSSVGGRLANRPQGADRLCSFWASTAVSIRALILRGDF